MQYLDSDKMNAMCQRLTPAAAAVCQFVWKHSVYYTTAEMIDAVDKAVDRFLATQPRNILLYMPSTKWGSEQYLATVFYDKLGRPPIVDSLGKIPPSSDATILLLDDATYSGTNLVYPIDCEITELFVDIAALRVCVVTGFYTDEALDTLRFVVPNVKLFSTTRMKCLEEIVADQNFTMNWYEFNKFFDSSSSIKDDGPEYTSVTTVWFEHKIANEFGSADAILRPVMKSEPDRTVVESSQAHQAMFRYL